MQLISVLPENFDLEELIQGSQMQVKGDIYNGHFVRGGKVWLDNVEIRFEKQRYKKHFDKEELKKLKKANLYDSV